MISYTNSPVPIGEKDLSEIRRQLFVHLDFRRFDRFCSFVWLASASLSGSLRGSTISTTTWPSEAIRYIDPFVKWFRKEFPSIPVDLYDERFTSRMAERSLLEAGVPRSARRDKSLVDKISASLILQSYLDAARNREQGQVK